MFDLTPNVTPELISQIWTAACGPALALSVRAATFNLRPTTGVTRQAWRADVNGEAAGFVVASFMRDTKPIGSRAPFGWVEAIAVRPEHQWAGLGSGLLAQAEAWLREQRAAVAILGGGLRPFAPGLPAELNNRAFFEKRGYGGRRGEAWDVARDLADFAPAPGTFGDAFPIVRAATPGDADALRDFFARAFPARWKFEFEEFLREGGRIGDYVIVEGVAGRVDGFCQTTFEDSLRPLDRFFHSNLPRPWGQAGPLGVSDELRGKGLGWRVVNAGLAQLAARGVRGCVIDWTDLLDFYAKFGFQPHRRWVMLSKPL